ncbi:hypothetical protein [Pseudoalteromonas sp. SaAl2]
MDKKFDSFKPSIPSNHLAFPVTTTSVKSRVSVLKSVFKQVEAMQDEYKDLLIELNERELERTKHEDTDDNYNSNFSHELYDLDFTFYRVHRISSVLTMYTYLENTLNRICQLKQAENNIPITVTDLSKSGIERAKTYLEKFKLVDFSGCNGHWSKIKNLSRLRNTLAHAEGDIEYSNNLDEKRISQIQGLSLSGSTIMISDTYIIEALDNIEDFLVYVCES